MRTSVRQLRDLERLTDLLRREALHRVQEIEGKIEAVLAQIRSVEMVRSADPDLAIAAFSSDWPLVKQRKIAKLNAAMAKLVVMRSDALAAVQDATAQREGVVAVLKRQELMLKRKQERAALDRVLNDRLCMNRPDRVS